jgi:glutamate N-acetyltransferase/amino-acid N-acetyltransferase
MTAMELFASLQEYQEALGQRAELPQGFQVSTTAFSFFPKEMPAKKAYPMNLSLIVLDQLTESFGAVFTRNSFPGVPVIIGKKRLQEQRIKGVLINNKISNVCAPEGMKDAGHILTALGAETGLKAENFFCASTGVIGWKLPAEEIIDKIPELVSDLKHSSLFPLAQAIMTTDAYPKIRIERLGEGKIVGIAKGAGMIEPNMATLLVFLLTDIRIERAGLQKALNWATNLSFNRISIDGDQSTSDMALIFSSGIFPLSNKLKFREALLSVCQKLAEDIVRNGEGVNHVVKVQVKNAHAQKIAERIAKAVSNSNLIKTALFGNDPNVGRIICAVGDYLGNSNIRIKQNLLSVSLGKVPIFSSGSFCLDAEKEKLLVKYLTDSSFNNAKGYPPHDKTVDLIIDMGTGKKEATVVGADLSYDYVKENSSYRS